MELTWEEALLLITARFADVRAELYQWRPRPPIFVTSEPVGVRAGWPGVTLVARGAVEFEFPGDSTRYLWVLTRRGTPFMFRAVSRLVWLAQETRFVAEFDVELDLDEWMSEIEKDLSGEPFVADLRRRVT